VSLKGKGFTTGIMEIHSRECFTRVRNKAKESGNTLTAIRLKVNIIKR
jgi:hypothetical protein